MESADVMQATWSLAVTGTPKEYFVWLDENCVSPAHQYSILPVLSFDSVIALGIFKGFVTRKRFLKFIRQELVGVVNSTLCTSAETMTSRHQNSSHILE